jgi:hypothetical protein
LLRIQASFGYPHACVHGELLLNVQLMVDTLRGAHHAAARLINVFALFDHVHLHFK